jgi:hypothetical protein
VENRNYPIKDAGGLSGNSAQNGRYVGTFATEGLFDTKSSRHRKALIYCNVTGRILIKLPTVGEAWAAYPSSTRMVIQLGNTHGKLNKPPTAYACTFLTPKSPRICGCGKAWFEATQRTRTARTRHLLLMTTVCWYYARKAFPIKSSRGT